MGAGQPSLLIPGLYPPYPMLPTPAGSGNFWTDFDYSARITFNPGGTPTGVQLPRAKFPGVFARQHEPG